MEIYEGFLHRKGNLRILLRLDGEKPQFVRAGRSDD